jgi:uncharacterized cupredoxin-like copper-binding protein
MDSAKGIALPTTVASLLAAAALVAVVPAARADQTVAVALVDQGMDSMHLDMSTDHVHAGKVTFDVTNKSDNLVHEFVVTRWNQPVALVPYDDNEKEADEDKLEVVNEIDGLDPGKSGTLTVTLEPGTYTILCNKVGHFKAGMVHTLTVTQ